MPDISGNCLHKMSSSRNCAKKVLQHVLDGTILDGGNEGKVGGDTNQLNVRCSCDAVKECFTRTGIIRAVRGCLACIMGTVYQDDIVSTGALHKPYGLEVSIRKNRVP